LEVINWLLLDHSISVILIHIFNFIEDIVAGGLEGVGIHVHM